MLWAVSDLKSFSSSAQEFRLAPASVTRIIAQLEQDLGTQLLVWTTRQVALTSAGAKVLARYRPLLEGFESVTKDLQRAIQPDHGQLQLTAPVSFGLSLLPKIMSGFRLAYPNISVEINFTDTLLDIIEENCDLARGDVMQVLPDWTASSLWLTLFYPPYEQLPPVVGTFAEYFESYVTEHPDMRMQDWRVWGGLRAFIKLSGVSAICVGPLCGLCCRSRFCGMQSA